MLQTIFSSLSKSDPSYGRETKLRLLEDDPTRLCWRTICNVAVAPIRVRTGNVDDHIFSSRIKVVSFEVDGRPGVQDLSSFRCDVQNVAASGWVVVARTFVFFRDMQLVGLHPAIDQVHVHVV